MYIYIYIYTRLLINCCELVQFCVYLMSEQLRKAEVLMRGFGLVWFDERLWSITIIIIIIIIIIITTTTTTTTTTITITITITIIIITIVLIWESPSFFNRSG